MAIIDRKNLILYWVKIKFYIGLTSFFKFISLGAFIRYWIYI